MIKIEQLISDIKSNEKLRQKIHEGLNRLRSDENLETYEAGILVAHDLGYEISKEKKQNIIADKRHESQFSPKISDYIDTLREQSYHSLFSSECLSALKNIQSVYGKKSSHHALYEVSLKDPAPTTDFSCSIHDEFLKNCWFEFDFNLYSKGNISHCTFTESIVPSESEDIICHLIGSEKFKKLRSPLNELHNFLKNRGLSIVNIGMLDNRGYSESVRIETRVRSCDKLFNIIREISYSGDLSLIEDTISKIRPHIRDEVFLFNFDLFVDRISDKIGISFLPFTSIAKTKNLINFLVRHDMCLPKKGQDLIKWKTDELPRGLLIQDINFIKIQFMKNKIITVKAYLMQSDRFPFYLS